jgi:mono/diheme cytochrome c family protein
MLGVVAVVLATLASATTARGADQGAAGKELYERYCSACHGAGGKGDGVAGETMKVRPADLTTIASRHGGEFPMEYVVQTIDGREALHAHGTPVMPVWGERLGDEIGGAAKHSVGLERRVQGRIIALAEYLKTIQAK